MYFNEFLFYLRKKFPFLLLFVHNNGLLLVAKRLYLC